MHVTRMEERKEGGGGEDKYLRWTECEMKEGQNLRVRTNVCGRVYVRRMRGEQTEKADVNICGGESAYKKDEREE